MLKIGSHCKLSSPLMLEGSVQDALSYGANALMVYTGAPQNTIRRNINEFRINEAITLMNQNQLSLMDLIIHAPYIINLANPDAEKRAFAVRFLSEEVIRTNALGSTKIVLHPGSAVGLDRTDASNWIIEGLNQVIENTKDLNVVICLETMAGKGNEMGKTFQELKTIIDGITIQSRIGVCLDTCHIFDAGYDIVNNLQSVLTEFDQIIGFDYLKVIHINDSKNPLGSHKDRHENLGFGQIGFETLIKIIYDERFKDIPKILETPYINDSPPYLAEIQMIKDKIFNPESLKKP